jgi:magnesium and cobalt transporter
MKKIKDFFIKIINNIFSKILIFKLNKIEDLHEVLGIASKNNIYDDKVLFMLQGVLNVGNLRARDLMVAKAKMITISNMLSFEQILELVIKSGHSRFPVENQDEVVGIMLAKDLLSYKQQNTEEWNIRDIMRPSYVIPESRKLNLLLHDFRTNRNHMAIVYDEYGNVSGLITIEDVLEQIVGDIGDEFDVDEQKNITSHGNNLWSVDATTTINEFNKYFKTHLASDTYSTIGGVLLDKFKVVPKPGKITKIGQLKFKIIQSDTRRIRIIQVQK